MLIINAAGRQAGSLVLAGALCCLAAATSSRAADPASGTVSRSQPKVSWTGAMTTPYPTYLQFYATGGAADTPCEAPQCDRFTVTVADGPADLLINETVTSPDANASALRVIRPDGTVVYNLEENGPAKLKIVQAVNGEYLIDTASAGKVEATYEASAELLLPAAGPSASAPPAAESFDLGVKVPRLSARQINRRRKLAVVVTTSRPVSAVSAVLRRGKRTVGKGAAKGAAGSFKLAIKAQRKLSPGKYSLAVQATSEQGVTVSRSVKVGIAR